MGPPHEGSWRGIYWHKNFTGSLMALWNAVFLLYGIRAFRESRWRAGACALLYLLSLVFIILSLSAAGIAIWLGLNLIIVILLLWNKIKGRLKKQHYVWLGYTTILLMILVITNLDLIFGLLNRDANLTGRLPLWNYLIEKAVIQKPFLGHGLGAIWDIQEFRRQATLSLGWSFVITNGHNGFMDILLGLGIVGLALAVLLLTLAFYRTGKYFVTDSTVANMLPLVIVMYFLLSNLSISFFVGIESFHWALLITAMFVSTATANHITQ
jgi:O-antigen ligase